MHKGTVLFVGMVVVASMASTGCVTKKTFRANVQETDSRIQGVESGVEANETRITEVAKETDSKIASVRSTAEKAVEIGSNALTRAEAAEKMAKGKILWTTVLSDDSVKFSFDQNDVPAMAASMLDELVERVRGMDKTVYLEIEGHTDNIGSAEHNQSLGLQRADAVRSYLHEKGQIPLHAMNVISYGESKPVADNGSSQGRSQNRRVVVRVLE